MADQAKSFIRPGNKKQNLSKTKALLTKTKTPEPIINEGLSFCTKCKNKDKSNMVYCKLCLGWYHYQCQSLNFSAVEFYVENPEVALLCKDCLVFVNSNVGKFLRENHEALEQRVFQTETDIISLESRIKAVEQQRKFDENLEFQEAVKKQIEKHIDGIRKEVKVIENKFEADA